MVDHMCACTGNAHAAPSSKQQLHTAPLEGVPMYPLLHQPPDNQLYWPHQLANAVRSIGHLNLHHGSISITWLRCVTRHTRAAFYRRQINDVKVGHLQSRV